MPKKIDPTAKRKVRWPGAGVVAIVGGVDPLQWTPGPRKRVNSIPLGRRTVVVFCEPWPRES